MFAYIKCVLAGLLLVAINSHSAMAWPDKPLRLFIGFQAGGGSDTVGRLIAEELRQALDTQVVIDNRPGASGKIAIEAALTANDGHTLLLYTHEFLTLPLVDKTARFQTLRDFQPIAMLAEGPYVFVAGAKAPFTTFTEFVAYARANPGKLRYASSGSGTQLHMLGHFVTTRLGLKMDHLPTRGGGGAVNDLSDGLVHLAVLGAPPVIPGVRDGRLKALAVSTPSRVPQLGDAPTLAELGVPDIAIYQRYGLVAPKGMPPEIVDRLAGIVSNAVMEEEIREKLTAFGLAPRPLSPADYQFELRDAERRWMRLIAENGLKLD